MTGYSDFQGLIFNDLKAVDQSKMIFWVAANNQPTQGLKKGYLKYPLFPQICFFSQQMWARLYSAFFCNLLLCYGGFYFLLNSTFCAQDEWYYLIPCKLQEIGLYIVFNLTVIYFGVVHSWLWVLPVGFAIWFGDKRWPVRPLHLNISNDIHICCSSC